MSLNEPSQFDFLKKQLRFKLQSNAGSLTILVALQLFALVLSFPAESGKSFFGEHSYIAFIGVSSTVHIVLIMVWAFYNGVVIANQSKWDEAFVFVTTRFLHHFSNLMLMLILSILGGLIASLIGPALRLLAHLRYGEIDILTPTITEAPSHFFIQFIAAIAYIFFLFILGYTISSFAQLGKVYGGIFAIGFLGIVFFITFISGIQIFGPVIFFLVGESFLPFFLMKITALCIALFSLAIIATNQLEVRNS